RAHLFGGFEDQEESSISVTSGLQDEGWRSEETRVDPAAQADDVIGRAGEVSPLIPCDTVNAICRSLEMLYYRPFHETRLVLTFCIFEPAELKGKRVQMFCRKDTRWKYIPESSALFKAACAALGRRLHRGEKITKRMFEKHLFRCRLRTAGKG